MRITAIILSLIILALIAVPCDHVVVINNSDTSFVTAASHSRNDLSKLCSPFSTHDSCSTVVILPTIYQNALDLDIIYSDLNSSYIFSFSKDFTNSIFQPPQV